MAVTMKIDGKDITFDVEVIGRGVALKATHINGKETDAGYLLIVGRDGRFTREPGVNKAFGFKLNDEDKIKKEKAQ